MLTQAVWWILVVAAVVVLLAAAYIAVLNWNETTRGTTVSVLLGAAVAFLLAVVTPLKAVDIEHRFVAPVVVDSSGSPVWLGQDNALPPLRLRQYLSGLHSLSEQTGAPAAIPIANPRQPTRAEQVALLEYTSRLLQHHLLRQFARLGPDPRVGVSVAETIRFELGDAAPGATAQILPNQIVDLSLNPFAAAQQEMETLRVLPVRTPPSTTVRLLQEPLGIQFRRPGYFTFAIEITSLGDLSPTPDGFEYLGSTRNQCRTYPYLVRLKAHFDRLTAGSRYSTHAQAWVLAASSLLRQESGNFSTSRTDS